MTAHFWPRASLHSRWRVPVEMTCPCGFVTAKQKCPQCRQPRVLKPRAVFAAGTTVETRWGMGLIRHVFPGSRFMCAVYTVIVPGRYPNHPLVRVLYGHELLPWV